MNTERPTRATVESTQLGSWTIWIRGSGVWDPDMVAGLKDRLVNAVDPKFATVRLIVVTNDYRQEVTHWREDLDRPPGAITDGPDAVAMASTVTWGDGQVDTTFSVIILDEGVAFRLLEDHSCALRIIRHELGHALWALIELRLWGPSSTPRTNDWPTLQRCLARGAIAEFFAEREATNALQATLDNADTTLTIRMCSAALSEISQSIARYRCDHDIEALWGPSVTIIDGALNQLGRQFGAFTAVEDSARLRQALIADLMDLRSEWGDAANRLGRALQEFHDGEAPVVDVDDAVEAAFHAVGLVPIQEDVGRLRVNVPIE
jgi:hypothetical protein